MHACTSTHTHTAHKVAVDIFNNFCHVRFKERPSTTHSLHLKEGAPPPPPPPPLQAFPTGCCLYAQPGLPRPQDPSLKVRPNHIFQFPCLNIKKMRGRRRVCISENHNCQFAYSLNFCFRLKKNVHCTRNMSMSFTASRSTRKCAMQFWKPFLRGSGLIKQVLLNKSRSFSPCSARGKWRKSSQTFTPSTRLVIPLLPCPVLIYLKAYLSSETVTCLSVWVWVCIRMCVFVCVASTCVCVHMHAYLCVFNIMSDEKETLSFQC